MIQRVYNTRLSKRSREESSILMNDPDQFHETGYVIRRYFWAPSDPVFDAVCKKARVCDRKYIGIFKKRYDKRRRFQYEWPDGPYHARWQTPFLTKLIKGAQELVSDVLYADSPSFLKSIPGCTKQPAHADYLPTDLEGVAVTEYPIGCLVSLQNDTFFDIWPGCFATNIESKQGVTRSVSVSLQAGDVLYFRADLIHAGSEYNQTNYRMHCYLNTEMVQHRHNRTWRVDYQPLLVQKLIQE